jgi:hypothetical protein
VEKATTYDLPALGVDGRLGARVGSAERITNMRRSPWGTWQAAGGLLPLIDPAQMVTYTPVDSMHWFARGGQQWVIVDYGGASAGGTGTLGWLDIRGEQIQPIRTGLTRARGPYAGMTYLEAAGWLLCFNGLDEPFRWNGKWDTRVGFPGPAPEPEVLDSDAQDQAAHRSDATTEVYANERQRGVGSLEVGTGSTPWIYGYRLTWVNELGMESPPSTMVLVYGSNPDLDPAAGADLTGKRSVSMLIPRAPAWARGSRLYRTVDLAAVSADTLQNQRVYQLVELVGGEPVLVTDDYSDGELGLELDETQLGAFPDGAHLGAFFKGVLFVSLSDEDGTLRYSAPLRFEQMPPARRIVVGGPFNGKITGLKTTKNALVVFKTRGIWLVKGDPASGFYAEPLTEDVGCVAPRSLVELPDGIAFLSETGPKLLQGALENTGTITGLVNGFGDEVGEVWRREVNRKALEQARAVVNTADREVQFWVPADGDDRTTLALVYHFDNGAWSLREGYPVSCAVETRDHRGYLFYGTWRTDTPGVFVYSRSGTLPGGDPPEATYRSEWVEFGDRELVQHLELRVAGNGLDATARWHKDYDVVSWNEITDGEAYAHQDSERVRPLWGTAVWSTTEVWDDYVPVVMRHSPHQANAFCVQWDVTGYLLEVYDARVRLKPRQGDVPKAPPRRGSA